MSDEPGVPYHVNLSHPRDFFSLRRYDIVPDTCFVLMPFSDDFLGVFKILEDALDGVMDCRRADDLRLGFPIHDRIMHGIATSELIIADLTGRNANVFYELGLAMTYTKNVMLLAQRIDDVPFDVKALFCNIYSIGTRAAQEQLKASVRKAAMDFQRKRLPENLEGAKARTEKIIRRLEGYLRLERLDTFVIRQQAGLSSLSNVGFPDEKGSDHREYGRLLEEERRLMIECLRRGAALQLMLSPPVKPWLDDSRYARRWETLLEFLNRRESYMSRCDVVLSPVPSTNILILGSEVLFEGYKDSLGRGFGLTMVYGESLVVGARIRLFDSLFASSREYTINRYGGEVPAGPEKLREAVVTGLRAARDGKV